MPGQKGRGEGMSWVPVPGELPVDSSSIKEATNAFKMLDLGSGGMWKAYIEAPPAVQEATACCSATSTSTAASC